jgi:hypothetical protein
MRLTIKRLRIIFHNDLKFISNDNQYVIGKVISYAPVEDSKDLIAEVNLFDTEKQELKNVKLNEVTEIIIIRNDDKTI